jgi:hypothetical protein
VPALTEGIAAVATPAPGPEAAAARLLRRRIYVCARGARQLRQGFLIHEILSRPRAFDL